MSEEKKSKKELNKERDERKRKRDEYIERKAERAKQIDTRVISTKSEDVGTCVNLLEQTDIAIIRMRKHIGGRVAVEDAMAIIERFEKAMLEIEVITKDAMILTNSTYIQPKSLEVIGKKWEKKAQ